MSPHETGEARPFPGGAHAFLEAAPLVPLRMDASSLAVDYVGSRGVALLGYPVERWSAPGFWKRHVLLDDQATLFDVRRRSAESESSYSVEYRMERADGAVVWLAERMNFVRSSEGPALVGYLDDVTDRKIQEISLWREAGRAKRRLREAPDALVVTDVSGIIAKLNEPAEALLGYPPNDVVGSSIDHLIAERYRARVAELRAAFERDAQRRSLVLGEAFSVQRADGIEVPVELSLSLIRHSDGSEEILWAVHDVAVRRRIERRADAYGGGVE